MVGGKKGIWAKYEKSDGPQPPKGLGARWGLRKHLCGCKRDVLTGFQEMAHLEWVVRKEGIEMGQKAKMKLGWWMDTSGWHTSIKQANMGV